MEARKFRGDFLGLFGEISSIDGFVSPQDRLGRHVPRLLDTYLHAHSHSHSLARSVDQETGWPGTVCLYEEREGGKRRKARREFCARLVSSRLI